MNDKLQPGDYVTGLTEEQFEELINVENYRIKLQYNAIGLCFNGKILLHVLAFGSIQTNELPYEEFLRRAKNTFQ